MYRFFLEGGVVHRRLTRPDHTTIQIPYLPTCMVQDVLRAYHDSPTGGHLGVYKTWGKIRDRFYWPAMFNQIKSYVLSCPKCQQFKTVRTGPHGTLQPVEPPTGVLDLMGLDFVGSVPVSSSGNKYILVCTDYLSRYAITQATVNCTAETAARFLVERVILQSGTSRQLLTDRGSHFVSNVFEAITSRCGVNHITATTYHPQCNGLTKRFNVTQVDSIETYVNQQQTDWDEYLQYGTFAYNTSKQATTQLEPFKLMFGRNATLPFDAPASTVKPSSANDYYPQLQRFLKQAKALAYNNTKRKQDIHKRTYDTGRQDIPTLRPGQLVLRKQMMAKNLCKFSPKFYGPFRVSRQLGRLNYEVVHVHDGHMEKVHVSRIRVVV